MKKHLLLSSTLMVIGVGFSLNSTAGICPDGRLVYSPHCILTPDGKFTESKSLTDRIQITPAGNYVSGSKTTLCPDGSYVGGSTCVLQPDGTYRGR